MPALLALPLLLLDAAGAWLEPGVPAGGTPGGVGFDMPLPDRPAPVLPVAVFPLLVLPAPPALPALLLPVPMLLLPPAVLPPAPAPAAPPPAAACAKAALPVPITRHEASAKIRVCVHIKTSSVMDGGAFDAATLAVHQRFSSGRFPLARRATR